MKNKVVLITGAKGGLGTHVTQRFLAAGASVAGVSLNISQSDYPDPAFAAFPADFSESASVNRVVDAVVQRFGKLDILVHVLGGFAGGKSVAETDDATWRQMQDMNLTAAFYTLRATLPYLRKSGSGRVIAIGSLTAEQPHSGLAAYVTFKSALSVLIQTVALENRDRGVTANVILPGTMDTPANRKMMSSADFSKWLPPGDVASLVLWLASEAAGHITGAAIPIAGTEN